MKTTKRKKINSALEHELHALYSEMYESEEDILHAVQDAKRAFTLVSKDVNYLTNGPSHDDE